MDFISANTSSKPDNTIASTLNKLSLKQLLSLPAEALREGGTFLNPQAYAQQDETTHSNLQLKTFMVPTTGLFPGQGGAYRSGDALAALSEGF